MTNRPATGEEPTWRFCAHKLDHASHTYFTSFPFLAPRATLMLYTIFEEGKILVITVMVTS